MKWVKSGVWTSLGEIDRAGLAEHPRLAALAYHPVTALAARRVDALKAQRSLIIRLLVRLPLRSPDVCALELDRSLRCIQGRWQVELPVTEHVFSEPSRPVDTYQALFPADLVWQLEEFIDIWRPWLPGEHRSELFTTRRGQPFDARTLNHEIIHVLQRRTRYAIGLAQLRRLRVQTFLTGAANFRVRLCYSASRLIRSPDMAS